MEYISNEELLRALSCIRKRPGMFLYPLTLASLGNYICGYKLCCTLNDIHQEEDSCDLLTEFSYWLQEQYHMARTNQYTWWQLIVKKVPEDGIHAIEEFYKMLDRFIDEKNLSSSDRINNNSLPSKAMLVKVNFLIEDDRGELNNKDIENAVWNAIPDNHKAVWQSTSELYLDSGSMNCGKCAKCQGWTTDKEKPNWIEGLCSGATVDGELLCDECLPKGHRWAF